eukprot:1972494-Ditylum_brightwellii.AAC.1
MHSKAVVENNLLVKAYIYEIYQSQYVQQKEEAPILSSNTDSSWVSNEAFLTLEMATAPLCHTSIPRINVENIKQILSPTKIRLMVTSSKELPRDCQSKEVESSNIN